MCYLLSVPFRIQTPAHPCTPHPFHSLEHKMYFHDLPFSLLFLHNICRASDDSAGGWSRTWAGTRYANVGGVTSDISDTNGCVTVGVMLGFASFFSGLFYSRNLHKKEEAMVFEAHCMPFPCTELLLFNCQGKHSFPFYGIFKGRTNYSKTYTITENTLLSLHSTW